MILALYIFAAVVMAIGSLYFAWRSREFRKFLAGAFFVSSGPLFYLSLADVSVPLLGTGFVATPQISGGRAIVHFILFLLCLYFGFVWTPKARDESPPAESQALSDATPHPGSHRGRCEPALPSAPAYRGCFARGRGFAPRPAGD